MVVTTTIIIHNRHVNMMGCIEFVVLAILTLKKDRLVPISFFHHPSR